MYKKSGLSVDGCQPYLCDDLYPRRDVILGTCPVKGRVHHKRRKTAKKRFKNTQNKISSSAFVQAPFLDDLYPRCGVIQLGFYKVKKKYLD